jgi:hypothetical protein
VVIERVDPDRERQLALELGAAADEHGMTPRDGTLAQLTEQPRLADPGLAADHQPARPRGAQGVERGVHRRKFLPPSDKSPGVRMHYRRHVRRR